LSNHLRTPLADFFLLSSHTTKPSRGGTHN
jgi:hypothetical protein